MRSNILLVENITRKTVYNCVKQGFFIFSGFAMGIDTIAHESALAYGGKTNAVVVDVINISPDQNRKLAQEIIEKGGLLISENPPGTKIFPALFAKGNRNQSGLAKAVFAIETLKNGGTLNAVKAANQLKRPVYAPDPLNASYADMKHVAISSTQLLIKDELVLYFTNDDLSDSLYKFS